MQQRVLLLVSNISTVDTKFSSITITYQYLPRWSNSTKFIVPYPDISSTKFSIWIYVSRSAAFTVPLGKSKFHDLGSLYIGKYLEVLHFCMCNFVWAETPNCALSAQKKFNIQKYDGLENMENPYRANGGNSGFKYRPKLRS